MATKTARAGKAAAKKPAKTKQAKKAAKRVEVAARKAAAKRVVKSPIVKKPAVERPAAKKAVTKAAAKTPQPAVTEALDLSSIPAESLVRDTRWLCLGCVLDLMTRHMGLSAERASTEIRRYTPSLEELAAATPTRPYFAEQAQGEVCPYCSAAAKWHAPLEVIRIEGGKSTDAARRALMKQVADSPKFAVIEEKSTAREALYHWLAKIGAEIDLDSPQWLLEAARHWLGRRHPKHDWAAVFGGVQFVRRARQMEEGSFALETPRLYLAPHLYDEILLIQYLLSRSHKAGGLTFEGRLTLHDLFHRLRGGGYLRAVGIMGSNPSDALEQLVELLGGEGRVKFHYIVDRRELLARLAALKDARVPRAKAATN